MPRVNDENDDRVMEVDPVYIPILLEAGLIVGCLGTDHYHTVYAGNGVDDVGYFTLENIYEYVMSRRH